MLHVELEAIRVIWSSVNQVTTKTSKNIICVKIFYMYRVRCCTTPDPPVFEMQVTVITSNFRTETFSIRLSWNVLNVAHIVISVNTLQSTCTNSTSECVIEGEYNIPYLINVRAINCVGEAEELATVFGGNCYTCHFF